MASGLQNVLFLARSDVQQKLRERETLLWVFLMPLLFFFFFGEATSGFAGGGDEDGRTVLHLEVPADAGPLAERLKQRLEAEGFALVDTPVPEGRRARRLLRVPAGLTQQVEAKERVQFDYVHLPDQRTETYDLLRLRKALYSTLADLVLLERQELPFDATGFAALDRAPRRLALDVAPAGRRKEIPSGYQQTVPGTMVMFTLMMMMTACAIVLVTERRQGLLRRLAATPITRGQLIAGKWLGFVALGAVQTGYAMLAGSILFGMQWGPNHLGVFVVLTAWVMFSASAGLFFGCLARSEAQASGLGVLVVLLLAALGGCWWPIEIVPGVMQDFARLLPTGWAMGALHGLVSFGGSLGEVGVELVLMLAGALVFGIWGARRFRYA